MNYYGQKLDGSYESAILNEDYFVTKHGRIDPRAELQAFKQLALTYQFSGKGQEILCHFPARLTLLEMHDADFRQFQRPDCPEYIEQNHPDAITSISMIFASGYFDNPSSYFGHTMLRYNYDDSIVDQTSLDSSLNYGANDTDDPSNPLYAIKGIFGGYSASFMRNNQFLNSHLYTNAQIRDLWEYELELTPEQRRFVVEHTWEVMRARFSYRFFNDNCAHHIAQVVELATGQRLSDAHGFWLLPLQVIRQLKTKDDQSLVKKETYVPSLKTLFSAKYHALTAKEKQQFIDYFDQTDAEKRIQVRKMENRLLFLMLDYLDLQMAKLTLKAKDNMAKTALQTQRSLILSELLRRPAASVENNEPVLIQKTLLDGTPPSSLRFNYKWTEDSRALRIGYRAANNDFLNIPIPGQEVSRFIMGELEAEYTAGSIELDRVTLIDIVNLNTNPLPMHMTNEYSWGLKIDYAPRSPLCSECSNFGIEGKVGKAHRLNDDVLFYGLAGGRIHTPDTSTQNYVTLVSEAGTVINLTESTVTHLSASHYLNLISGKPDYVLSANLAFNIHHNLDYRISFDGNDQDTRVMTGFALYFD